MAEFKTILQVQCGLKSDVPLLVGVSGGPDSLCLLDLLQRAGQRVAVAHFDHALRDESAAEAQFVAEFARQRGLEFVIGRGAVAELAAVQHLSLEEAARSARYAFLFEQARRCGAQAVAVAHHADDQVETVLMHLLRGSGISGLKGMACRTFLPVWDENIPLVRPLLGMWRAEVLEYCTAHGLQPVMDASNQDATFFRNRLRLELIPYLETFNPQIKEAVWRTADTLAEDQQVLAQAAAEALEASRCEAGTGFVSLSRAALREMIPGLRRSVIRLAAAQLRPALRDIDYEAVLRADAFILDPPQSRCADWISGLQLRLEEGRLFLAESDAQLPEDQWPQAVEDSPLPVPGSLPLAQGWRLEAGLLNAEQLPAQEAMAARPLEAWLGLGAEDSLTVRTALPGERFSPLGMAGHSMKLSDFFVNEKTPRRARSRWPLVCCGEEIAWVCGLRSAEPFRAGPHSGRVVHLRLVRD